MNMGRLWQLGGWGGWVAVVIVALCGARQAVGGFVYPVKVPAFYQCGEAWSDDLMGGGATICQQGCAMCSVTMHLAARNVTIPGVSGGDLDPGVFNKWLIANHGYVCIQGNCNNLNLTDVPAVDPGHITYLGENPKPPAEDLRDLVRKGVMVIAHVRNNHHFVAVTGYDLADPLTYAVNDPNRYTSEYEYDEMSDLILYGFSAALMR